MKKQRAITLIALIITIVILLILSMVTIALIKNNGIILHASDVVTRYNQAQENEKEILDEYLNYIPGSIGDVEVGTKAEIVSTINGQKYSATNPVIPVGFMPINTATSSWDADDLAEEVKKGLVISDGTSEFVWIPVETLSDMAVPTSGTDKNGRTNYKGVLYNWAADSTGKVTINSSHREPFNISSTYENEQIMQTWTDTLYQEEFNKMVESVAIYKGFYVGRYEISLNGNVAQSKSGETPLKGVNWFEAYEKSKTYSTSNTSLGVVSEMIWGCQWDMMLKFILTGSQASHVTSTSNVSHDLSSTYKTGGTDYSGSIAYNDIAANIYDLEGNCWEWTQTAAVSEHRVFRGGFHCYNEYNPSSIDSYYPIYDDTFWGSRLALYVSVEK